MPSTRWVDSVAAPYPARILLVALCTLVACGATHSGGDGAPADAATTPDGAAVDAGASEASGGGDAVISPQRDAATADDASQPPHVKGDCSSLAPAGQWENVTPPQVAAQLPGPGACTFGTGAFVLDPSTSGTIYLGSCNMGIWKSVDCGSTWTHVNTGVNGGALDNGRQWTFDLDPMKPQVLYANAGYSSYVQNGTWVDNGVSGAFKSTNSGVDWQPIWPPADPTQGTIVPYNFVMLVAADPLDSQHLLISFHAPCNPPHTQACLGESKDGGQTWQIHDGDPSWTFNEASFVYFIDGGGKWLWEPSNDTLYRTEDSGATWTPVLGSTGGHNGAPLYRATDGSLYLALNAGLFKSSAASDGAAWTMLMSQPMLGITGDGTTLFAASGFSWNPGQGPGPYEPFYTSPESDGTTWTSMASPMLTNGGGLAYDPDHHVLFSSNLDAGFYRVVTQ
jgi:hypothetical protein